MSQLRVTCECGQTAVVEMSKSKEPFTCTLCGREVHITPDNAKKVADQAPVTAAPASAPKEEKKLPSRVLCLDQLRGYAIFGMIMVNYLGYFGWMPHWFEHNKNHFSYADTIAPLFIFVVGMGFRLSLKARAAKIGESAALAQSAKRYVLLFVVGVLFYGPSFRVDWWDAMIQIGLSGLVALFFINRPIAVRLGYGVFCLALFSGIYFGTDYGDWMSHRSMNGGPLSPFTYVFVLLAGTIAYDMLDNLDGAVFLRNTLLTAAGLLVAGIVVLMILPKDTDTVREFGALTYTAKRWSVAPYILISTSCAFLAFAIFYWVNEVKGIEIPHLSILGMNPLAIYLLQYSLLEMRHSYLPEQYESASANPLVGLTGYVIFYLIVYGFAKRLHNDKIIIKL